MHPEWATSPDLSEAQRQAARLPIIALTAATLPEEKNRCFEAGMTDYLSKPLKLSALQAPLETAVRWPGRAAPRPIPRASSGSE